MTRRTIIAWSASVIVLLLLTLAGWYFWPVWFPGRSVDTSDRSIVVSNQYEAIGGAKVENGSAFDRAALDVAPYKVFVLPDDAEVRDGAPEKTLQIFMHKRLAFGGHPPERMSIRGARKNMGCAIKAQDDTLTVATFGEWNSHIEGGAFMGLLFVVPKGVEVRREAGLSGEDSAGREWKGDYLTKPKDAKDGYWYGPASPADGWSAVPDVPDPERHAGEPPPWRSRKE
jgi:hypothetical protein